MFDFQPFGVEGLLKNLNEKRKFIHSVFAALVFLIILMTFSGTLSNLFVPWDDDKYILNSPIVKSLSPGSIYGIFTGLHQYNYWHPLAWLSHAVDYHYFGLDPKGHHLTSVVIHGLNSVLVYFLFVSLVGAARPDSNSKMDLKIAGVIAALAFGLHPLRVESVAWVAERKDLLCGFFYFSSLLVYIRYSRISEKTWRVFLYLGTLVLFCLGLMSKPLAVTLPAVLLLLDWYPLKRFAKPENRRQVLLEKIPFFALSLAFSAATMILQKSGMAVKALDDFPLGQRLLNAVRSLSFYFEQTFWPSRLVPFYPFDDDMGLASGKFILSAIMVAGLSLFCWRQLRKGRKIAPAAWMYYLITVFPAIGIVQVGEQAAADRFTYIATLSIYFLIGTGILQVLESRSGSFLKSPVKIVTLTCGVLVLFSLSALTHRQIKVWRNGETLWTYVIQHYPDQIEVAHNNLGGYYLNMGRLEEAETHLKIAVRLQPGYRDAHYNLGFNYYKRGKLDESASEFKKVLSLDSRHIQAYNKLGLIYSNQGEVVAALEQFDKALAIDNEFAAAWNNRALVFYKTGRLEEAEKEFKQALKSDPDYLESRNNLGTLYQKSGRLDEAERELQKALEISPDRASVHYNLGLVNRDRGNLEAAERKYKKALDLDSGLLEARNELAIIFLRDGRLVEAEKQMINSLKTRPDYFDGHNTLGAVYFKAGKWKEAEAQFIKALEIDPAKNIARVNLEKVRRILNKSTEPQTLF